MANTKRKNIGLKNLLWVKDTVIALSIRILIFLCFLSSPISAQISEIELEFPSSDGGFILSGTLAKPLNTKPLLAVVLLSGSGQTDRDASMFGQKFFKQLSDSLVGHGYAVLRYDDRGGFKSKGPKVGLSTIESISKDAASAVEFLNKKQKIKKIALLGHSEGGGVVSMVKNKHIKCLVALAGPCIKGSEVLIRQNKDILVQMGINSTDVDAYLEHYFKPMTQLTVEKKNEKDFKNAWQNIRRNYQKNVKDIPFALSISTDSSQADIIEKSMNNPYFQSFLSTDFNQSWSTVKVPSLLLFGEKDLQVEPSSNAAAAAALNRNYLKIETLKNHNHLFQVAKTGAVSEYASLKSGYSVESIQKIIAFLDLQL
jgi:uncharacterized protein